MMEFVVLCVTAVFNSFAVISLCKVKTTRSVRVVWTVEICLKSLIRLSDYCLAYSCFNGKYDLAVVARVKLKGYTYARNVLRKEISKVLCKSGPILRINNSRELKLVVMKNAYDHPFQTAFHLSLDIVTYYSINFNFRIQHNWQIKRGYMVLLRKNQMKASVSDHIAHFTGFPFTHCFRYECALVIALSSIVCRETTN